MSDLISREAAIDIERNATVDTNPSHFEAHQKFTQFMDDAEISSFGRWQWSNGFNTALTAVGIDLKKLPSAQPETHEKRTETHACDCISRQAAINEFKCCELTPDGGIDANYAVEFLAQLPSAEPDLDEWCTDCKEYDHDKHCCPRWNRVIRQTLKDAQPERTGLWIDHTEDGYVECPFCHSATNCDDNIDELHFCFSCGAKMEVEHEI